MQCLFRIYKLALYKRAFTVCQHICQCPAPPPAALGPFASDLQTMVATSAKEWRVNDAHRRRAIHEYIRMNRAGLLCELPAKFCKEKETKRNELVRLGRRKFASVSPEVQMRFLTATAIAQTLETDSPAGEDALPVLQPLSGSGGDVEGESGSSGVREERGEEVEGESGSSVVGKITDQQCVGAIDDQQCEPMSQVSGSSGVWSGDAGAFSQRKRARVDLADQQAPSDVTAKISSERPFLEKLFPGALVFDVLAASIRISEHMLSLLGSEPVHVPAAIIISMGAKLAMTGSSHTLKIWETLAGPKSLPHLKALEVRVVNAWAKSGLDVGQCE